MSPIAQRFSRAAQTYDRGADLHRHVAARLLEMMPEPESVAPPRILEVGCGTGVLTDRLRQRYPATVLCAMDVAEGMVSCVRERWSNDPNMQFLMADIRDFCVTNTFGLVASSSALHWATPLEQTFENIRRSLVPGGAFCAALMVDGTLGELHALRRRIAPGKSPIGRLPAGDEVISVLEGAGFKSIRREEETIRTRYHSADDFLGTIHAQGLTSGPVSRAALPLSRAELKRLRKEYDMAFRGEGGGVYATFVVLYLSAEA